MLSRATVECAVTRNSGVCQHPDRDNDGSAKTRRGQQIALQHTLAGLAEAAALVISRIDIRPDAARLVG
jgi:hypothetical protein